MPKYIHLGYRSWTVQYDLGATDDEYGEFVASKGKILLSPGFDPVVEVDTLLHEIIHAMFHNAGNPLSTKMEEVVTTILPHAFVELWQRNPYLIQWIEESLRGDNESLHNRKDAKLT